MESYRTWAVRQSDPDDPAGISPVCLPWVQSFDQFVHDVGLRPDNSALLVQDPTRPVGPGNCYWGPPGATGHRGRKPSIRLEHDGRKLSLRQWSELSGIPYATLYDRLRRGNTAAEALGLNQEAA
jgi:hypothetical protein